MRFAGPHSFNLAVGGSYRKSALDHERGRRRHVQPARCSASRRGNHLRSSSRTLSRIAAAKASLMCHSASNRNLGRPLTSNDQGFAHRCASPQRERQLRNRCRAEPVHGSRQTARGMLPLQLRGDCGHARCATRIYGPGIQRGGRRNRRCTPVALS